MGFSSQLDFIRAFLLRIHKASRRSRRGQQQQGSKRGAGAGGCVGRIRSLSIPTLASLKGRGSWREKGAGGSQEEEEIEAGESRNPRGCRSRRAGIKKRSSSSWESEVITRSDGVRSLEEEFAQFLARNPEYLETTVVDDIRADEYGELGGRVCLDYSGYGLFSQLQQLLDAASASFALCDQVSDGDGELNQQLNERSGGYNQRRYGEDELNKGRSDGGNERSDGGKQLRVRSDGGKQVSYGETELKLGYGEQQLELGYGEQELELGYGGKQQRSGRQLSYGEQELKLGYGEEQQQVSELSGYGGKQLRELSDGGKELSDGENDLKHGYGEEELKLGYGEGQQQVSELSGYGGKQLSERSSDGGNKQLRELGYGGNEVSGYGGAAPGTLEFDLRRRILRFLNLPPDEYSLLFTPSRASAFLLLARSFPFSPSHPLLSVYDHRSHALSLLQRLALLRHAPLLSASFHWPSLALRSPPLKAHILHTPKHGGLFAFPVQSRVSGSKYSYQWMSLAQENGWNVLLDASALGPKDMDSLGLSLFRPDFIVTSFYRVFGSDPTGFGCLFIKNSSMGSLRQPLAARGAGTVRLVPVADVSSPSGLFEAPIAGEGQKYFEIEEAFETMTLSRKGKAGYGETAFSGPIYRHNQSPQSHPNDMDDNLGAVDEDCARVCKKACPSSSSGSKHALQESNDDPASQAGRSWEEELKHESGKPTTPRSVLEESLIEGGDQSYDGRSEATFEFSEAVGKGKKEGESLHCSELGAASWKQREPSAAELSYSPEGAVASKRGELDVAPLHNSTISSQKRSFLAYHSYEIGRAACSFVGAGTFSQPLISQDTRRDFSLAHSDGSSFYAGSREDLEFSSSLYQEDEESSEFGMADDASIVRREPEIFCRGLNHADTLGLNKTNDRLRFLINWLVSSLLKLQHLVSNKFVPLVHIYGPKVKYDRGASLAFNLMDRDGVLIRPILVQQLADKNNISLGTALLCHTQFLEDTSNLQGLELVDATDSLYTKSWVEKSPRFTVVTAALGLVTNFEDVYRVWAFVAKFLDA